MKTFALSLFFAGEAHRTGRAGAYHWGHEHNGADWSAEVAECGMERQSPIDIPAATAEKPGVPFITENYDSSVDWIAKNTGHGVQLDASSLDTKVSGGDLPGTYLLAQFHFHWGSADQGGSEHTVDGVQPFAEIHLVHIKEDYAVAGDYMDHDDGLAVLGFFVDVDDGVTEGPLDELIQTHIANNLLEPSSTSGITGFAMDSILPATFDNYYRYLGSLTTPGCNEVVVWTVFKDAIKISPKTRDLMLSFAEFDTTDVPLVKNYRAVQALNGREVTFYSNEVVEEVAMPCQCEFGHCTDSAGADKCDCFGGFTLSADPWVCEDVDECSTGGSICHKDAKCMNTLGSYACKCNDGFIGNGLKCMNKTILWLLASSG